MSRQTVELAVYRGAELLSRQRKSRDFITLGSSRFADVTIPDASVARRHARIMTSSLSVMVEDARSDLRFREARVGGQSAFGSWRTLRSGDAVELGEVRVVVTFGQDLANEQPSAPLGPAPRRVPLAMAFGELFACPHWFAFGTYVFILVMSGVMPMALWITHPEAFAPFAFALLAVLVVIRVVKAAKRLRLLAWGRQARVLAVQSDSTNTYWSGVAIPVATGWRVDRGGVGGRGYKNTVKYAAEDGREHWLVHRGMQWGGGVILYDAERPDSALCVDAFACDLDRDGRGDWVGGLRSGQIVAAVALIVVTAVWIGAAIASIAVAVTVDAAPPRPSVARPAVVAPPPAAPSPPTRPARKGR
jgi:hypothetical protein